MKNFWQGLKEPIFILAPMEDVTDSVFRQVVASCAKPDVFFTEFTSVEGILSPKGNKIVTQRLEYTELERPVVAQIWGKVPENFYKVAGILEDMGFDGIDINMGCPVSSVVNKGSCSALIKNPKLTKEIIDATIAGAKGLPVSVKTRLGFNEIQTEEWIGFLLTTNIAALAIHGRTVKEMSKVPAHWDEISKAVEIRNKLGVDIKIIGNGDIKSAGQANQLIKKYKVDGVMIGRGIFHDMWIFNKKRQKYIPTLNERFELLLKHTRLFDQTWGKSKNFAILKKFFKAYISDFEGAAELRMKLMKINNLEEVEIILRKNLKPLRNNQLLTQYL